MKICHLTTYCEGGAAKACLRLHKGLLKEGVDSKVLVLHYTPIDIPEVYDYMKLALNNPFSRIKWRIKESIKWRYLKYMLKGKSNEYDFFSTDILHQSLENLKIFREADIIHLHWVANFIDYDEILQWDKKIVWTLHDMNPFTGGCHYVSGCEQFVSGCEDCPQLLGARNTLIVRNVFAKKRKLHSENNITIVSPSKWLKLEAERSLILRSKDILHIPNGVDTDVFKPISKETARKHFGLPSDKKIILFVADDISNKRKGLHLLINALRKISLKNILLCALGNENGLKKNDPDIHFFGKKTDGNEIALIYSSADLFVIPSVEDNLPNTILEAMSCGLPIVGFNIGGIPDMVTNGENGYLVEVRNIKDLSEKILHLIENNKLLSKFGIKSRQKATTLFSLKKQVETYQRLYSQL